MPVNNVNTSFNDGKALLNATSSVIFEILRKADEAENTVVLPSPTAESDRKLPEGTRRSLMSVISWAKRIPMFTLLLVDDQIKLVKESWKVVNALKLIYHFAKLPTEGDSAFKSDEVEYLYLTDNPKVVFSIQKLIKKCASTMWEIRLDKTELSCLKLITLMNPCEYIHNNY